ncbi:restriction endonuclease subunit S [Mesorhizobium sp. ORM8.1]
MSDHRHTRLSKIAKVSSGSTPPRAQSKRYFSNVGTAWVKTGDLNNSIISDTDEKLTQFAIDESRSRIFPAGTVLVAMYGGFRQIGRTGLLSIPAAINQAISAIELDRKKADPSYVLQYLNGRVGYWRRFAASSRKDPNITRSDVEEFPIFVPSLPEQHRVAEILNTWDIATAVGSRLIENKQRRILGMLAERVSDARQTAEQGGWEKTTIGDVTTLAQQRVAWDEDATYRLITVKRGCGGLVFRGDRKGHEILTKDMYTVRAGDFLISKRQVVHGAWAMVPPEFDGGHVSKEYACLRAKPGKLWMPYFDWLSRTERLQHEAFICSYGVDIEKMVLNVEWLLQTPLLLPHSIETQKAMAAGLDSLQREVDLLKAQMEALRRQKRGLMQKLLTGEWRVPVRDSDVDAMAARITEEAAQ